MSAIDDVLASIPMDQLADRLGTDPETASEAVRQVLPGLFTQLQYNADQPDSQGLAGAFEQHSSSTMFDSGTVNLDDVDTTDGSKIVGHIFGSEPQQAYGVSGQAGQGLLNKLLPILAPIVMAYLGKQMANGGFGDILGQVLGGGPGQSQQDGGGGVLGQILGQVLGAGQQTPQASGNDGGGGFLDDLLGGLFGKK